MKKSKGLSLENFKRQLPEMLDNSDAQCNILDPAISKFEED